MWLSTKQTLTKHMPRNTSNGALYSEFLPPALLLSTMRTSLYAILAVALAGVSLAQARMLEISDFELSHSDNVPIFSSREERRLEARKLGKEEYPRQLRLQFTADGKPYETILHREIGRVFSPNAKAHLLGETEGDVRVVPMKNGHIYRSADREWTLGFYHNEAFEGIHRGDEFISFRYNRGLLEAENQLDSRFEGGILNHLTVDTKAQGTTYRKLVKDNLAINCYRGESQMRNFSIGVAVGFQLVAFMGAEYSQTNMRNFIQVITVVTNDIFGEQLNLLIEVDSVVIAETSAVNSLQPWNNPGCSKDISTQLFQMQRWTTRPKTEGLWHLLDKCFGFSGSTLGIAKLGVLCARAVNVGVSYATGNGGSFSTALDLDVANDFAKQKVLLGTPTWATYAHELGHNFGASHSFELGQGRTDGIMDYGSVQSRFINGEIQFNGRFRKRELCGEINSVVTTCSAFEVLVPPTPSPTAAGNDCVVFQNKVYRGVADVDAGGYDGSTINSCLQRCEADSACNSFVVSEVRGYCELWSKQTTKDLDDVTSAESTFMTVICNGVDTTTDPNAPTSSPTKAPRTCVRHRNRVIAGAADLYSGSYDGWSLQECFDACQDAPGCKIFTHSGRFGYCELWSEGSGKSESDFQYYFGYDSIVCQVANEAVASSSALSDNVINKDVSAITASCCSSATGQYNLAEGTFPVLTVASASDCANLCVESETCLTSSFDSSETTFNCELFSVMNFTGTGAEFANFETTTCNRQCITRAVFEEEFGPLTPAEIGIITASAVVFVVAALGLVAFRQLRRKPSRGKGVDMELKATGGEEALSHYMAPGNEETFTAAYATSSAPRKAPMPFAQQQASTGGHYVAPTL